MNTCSGVSDQDRSVLGASINGDVEDSPDTQPPVQVGGDHQQPAAIPSHGDTTGLDYLAEASRHLSEQNALQTTEDATELGYLLDEPDFNDIMTRELKSAREGIQSQRRLENTAKLSKKVGWEEHGIQALFPMLDTASMATEMQSSTTDQAVAGASAASYPTVTNNVPASVDFQTASSAPAFNNISAPVDYQSASSFGHNMGNFNPVNAPVNPMPPIEHTNEHWNQPVSTGPTIDLTDDGDTELFSTQTSTAAQPQDQSPNPAPAELGLTQKSARKEGRAQFTEDVRKKVSDVRKLGACVRCRMLKKSCSAKDPCDECGKINSARIWKQSCVRSRLEDELTLYRTGIFKTKAEALTNAACLNKTMASPGGQILARFSPDHDFFLSFAPMAAVDMSSNEEASEADKIDFDNAVLVVDLGDKAGTSDMDSYLDRLTERLVEEESNGLLKATMVRATASVAQQEVRFTLT